MTRKEQALDKLRVAEHELTIAKNAYSKWGGSRLWQDVKDAEKVVKKYSDRFLYYNLKG